MRLSKFQNACIIVGALLTSACQLKTPAALLENPNQISFSPPAGTYGTAQSITLTSNVAGSTICYTTDGSSPRCAGASGCTSGQAFTSAVAIAAPVSAVETTTLRAVGCKQGSATYPIETSVYVLDTKPPILLSSAPAAGATNVPPCSGSPCTATIMLVFDESLNFASGQTLTMEIQDSTTPTYAVAPSTNATFTFSKTNIANDTLTIGLGWINFPENATIRFNVAAAGITDVVGNAVTAPVQQIFTTTTRSVTYPVADSGLTTCSDDTVMQTCPQISHPRQDADLVNVPNARSFTGPIAHATFTSDHTTTDNVSGLTWKSCSEGLSDATCSTGTASTFTWQNAINQCAALNTMNSNLGYANRTNWQLPTIADLLTLANMGVAIPSIDISHFPGAIAGQYWSGTSVHNGPASAWNITFGGGSAGTTLKTNALRILCVSKPVQTTAPSFTDNGDGTIFNSLTNLTWTKCPMDNSGTGSLLPFATNCAGTRGSRTWSQSLTDCNNLALAGKAWRLPNLMELNSIIDRSVSSPAINNTYFPNAGTAFYWSATALISNLTRAWTVLFSSGSFGNVSAKTTGQNTRCVATGP